MNFQTLSLECMCRWHNPQRHLFPRAPLCRLPRRCQPFNFGVKSIHYFQTMMSHIQLVSLTPTLTNYSKLQWIWNCYTHVHTDAHTHRAAHQLNISNWQTRPRSQGTGWSCEILFGVWWSKGCIRRSMKRDWFTHVETNLIWILYFTFIWVSENQRVWKNAPENWNSM